MNFVVGQNVRAKDGDYTGYYGLIAEISGNQALVKLRPDVAGFWILLDDLEENFSE